MRVRTIPNLTGVQQLVLAARERKGIKKVRSRDPYGPESAPP